jgi:4-amino-4-deoxy-L-arabinose transferase-like glycosyltransferase
MSRKRKIWLLILGLFIAWITAWWVNSPGYMDADYYFAMGKTLASGGGLHEPFIWNYLTSPSKVPTPAFQYWMPMTSFLSALSQMIFGIGFRIAQLPFIIIVALLPLFTGWVAYSLLEDEKLAWQAGILSAIPGYFLPFLVTTDSFAIYMILGPLVFITIYKSIKEEKFHLCMIPGILSGIAHLTRVDGIVFLLLGVTSILLYANGRKGTKLIGLILGYLVVMMPWWITNWALTGSPLAAGTSRVLWATNYDELFAFPPEKLSFQNWIGSGWGNILSVRLEAIWSNLKTLVFVNGVIFLSPFMILGGWQLRKRIIIRLAFFYVILLFFLMSLLFPFAGSRGGFFHSSSAIMPVLWSLAPLGLKILIEKGVEIRNWNRVQAMDVFATAMNVLVAIITLSLFWTRVVGDDFLKSNWSSRERMYSEIAMWFDHRSIEQTIVAVNNPPAFFTQSGFYSVVIPDGDEIVLRQVVKAFNVEWVVLDDNNPGLRSLYENPELVHWLEEIVTFEKSKGERVIIFKVLTE